MTGRCGARWFGVKDHLPSCGDGGWERAANARKRREPLRHNDSGSAVVAVMAVVVYVWLGVFVVELRQPDNSSRRPAPPLPPTNTVLTHTFLSH